MNSENQGALQALDTRLRTILPVAYQDCYDEVQPVSMGSAALKYGDDGKVAWDEIWGSFCDLAMAGGPPHKGTLLEPGSPTDIDAQPQRYREVVDEICRGIRMVTDLAAVCSATPGWITVHCATQTMAEWLVRAIAMENISVHQEGTLLDLPAGPGYRIEKEIKNVITAIAKTSHYWLEHMWPKQHREISQLFLQMSVDFPLIQPAGRGHGFRASAHRKLSAKVTESIRRAIRLEASEHQYTGWLGVQCPDIRMAVWMMRALVASNVLSRREGTTLFLPINPASDPEGNRAGQSLIQVHGFASQRDVL